MTHYYPIVALRVYCVSDKIFIKENHNKSFIEAFRVGLGGVEDYGIYVAKSFSILSYCVLPKKHSAPHN